VLVDEVDMRYLRYYLRSRKVLGYRHEVRCVLVPRGSEGGKVHVRKGNGQFISAGGIPG
jgi:hypothetical protein